MPIRFAREAKCPQCDEEHAAPAFVEMEGTYFGRTLKVKNTPAYKCPDCGQIFGELNAAADAMRIISPLVDTQKGLRVTVRLDWSEPAPADDGMEWREVSAVVEG